jgi:hypothetical protein
MRTRLALAGLATAAAVVSGGLLAASAVAVPLQATSACQITQKRSLTGTAKTTITFVNKTGSAVQLYWLDYKGHLVYYSTVAPGGRVAQRTFKTHPWLVLNTSFACVGYVIAPKTQYVITP